MSLIRKDIDDFDVRFMYEVEGMTQWEIADYYGVSRGCIQARLHPEKRRESNNKWRLKNPDYDREYRQEHSEEIKEYVKQWRLEKPEYTKEWWKTDAGKEVARIHNAARRDLGSIELNKPFPCSEFHHIDEEHGIHMPKELHHSIYHNLKTGQGMEEINTIAFRYISEETFDKLLAGEV